MRSAELDPNVTTLKPREASPTFLFGIRHLSIALILLGGFLLRMVFFLWSLPSAGAPLIRDEGNYVGIAEPLSRGLGFVEKWVWLRPPGYPAFIATFLAVPGGSLPVAAFAQILLSVANIWIVYALAMEVFAFRPEVPRQKARMVSLAAAALMAANPHIVFYANLLMAESVYMLALSVVAWLLLRASRAWRSARDARAKVFGEVLTLIALAGLAAAAGALIRSLLLTLVPLLLAWFWWVQPRRAEIETQSNPMARRWSRASLLPLLLFTAVIASAILPWTIRNFVHYHRFLLIDTVSEYNLWQYNGSISAEEIDRRLLEIPNPVDRARFSQQQGIASIMADPAAFAGVAVERFADAWPVDHFGEFRAFFKDKYPGTDCTNLDIFAWLGTLFYLILGLCTIWGFTLAPGRAFKSLVLIIFLHYGLTTMLAHAEFRYRLPLYPFASVYAGWALAALFERRAGRLVAKSSNLTSTRKKTGWVAAAAIVSLLFLVQCVTFMLPGLPNSVRYERRYLAGKNQFDKGDYASALASFTGAAQIDRACACLYRYIGLAQGKLGQPDKERAAYTTAISREEHDWRTRVLLSDRLRSAGDPRAANPVNFTRAEFRDEQEEWAWSNLAPPAEAAVDVGGTDIGFIRGFQAAESEPGQGGGKPVTYRWSAELAYVRLPTPAGSGKLHLVVRWHSLAWPGKPNPNAQVHILVNGHEAGTLTAHPAWEEGSLDVSSIQNLAAGKVAVVELITPVDRPPGGEERLLGVALDSVRFTR